MSDFIKRCSLHPIIKGTLIIIALVACAEFFILFIQPAWAAISFPIGERIQVNLGDVSQIVIAIGILAGFWRSWKSEKVVLAVKADVAEIKHQTNSLTDQLKAAARKEGLAEGEQKGVDAANTLAEGQRQGRDAALEIAGALVTPPVATPLAAAGESEVPVKDGTVASATKRIAEAVERATDAAVSAPEGETK